MWVLVGVGYRVCIGSGGVPLIGRKAAGRVLLHYTNMRMCLPAPSEQSSASTATAQITICSAAEGAVVAWGAMGWGRGVGRGTDG